MKLFLRRILVFLVLLILVFSMTIPASADLSEVYVAGVKMDNGRYLANGKTSTTTVKPSGGYAYYKDGVLILNNFSCKREEGNRTGIVSNYGALELVLINENSIVTRYDDDGIYVADSLTIRAAESGGSLKIETVNTAIHAGQNLVIQNCGIDVNKSYYGISAGDVKIEDSEVDIVGTIGISAYHGRIDIDDANISIESKGTGIENDYGGLTVDNSDIDIYSNSNNGIFVDSSVSIKNSEISLELGEKGVNAYETEDDYYYDSQQYHNGIYAGGSIKITDGKLEVNKFRDGIYSKGTVTIEDGNYNFDVGEQGIYGNKVLVEDGTFSIVSDSEAIKGYANVTINGGSFNLDSLYQGIYSSKVIIQGGTFDIEAYSAGIEGRDVLIKSGDLIIDSDFGIYSTGPISVEGGDLVIEANLPVRSEGTTYIHGGNLVLTSTDESIYKDRRSAIVAGTGIYMSDKLMVQASTEPYGALVPYVASNNSKYDYIVIIEKLKSPSISCKADNISGKPFISWSPVVGANKYYIYSSNSKNGEYSYIGSVTKDNYIDKSAVVGKVYYYKVRAINTSNSNVTSPLSGYSYVTCDLASPTMKLSTVASTGKPVVTWNTVPGATKYEVYRKVGSEGTYELYHRTTETSLTNTSAEVGTRYYYKIKAIYGNNSAANSAFSNADYVTCDLASPTMKLSTVASTGKPLVTWNAVKGATKYEVYRKVGSEGTYELYHRTTETSLTNTSAEVGKRYYYKIKAIYGNNSAANSAFSNADYVTCDLSRPNVKVSLTSSGKPMVTWNQVAGATKYEVYRKVGSDGSYKLYYTTTGTSLNNTSAEKGKTYYYKVRAIYGSNSAANSVFSNEVYRTAK